jgi:iron(III) transport system substrate-binding protein
MHKTSLSRRALLKASAALPFAGYATRVMAAAPPATSITPELIAAAKKEGNVVWYTSADLQVAEGLGKAFERKFGVTMRVERAGAERIFTRIAQEYAANIHSVDACNTGDLAQFITWKEQKLLAPYVPEDVAKHIPADYRDVDGMHAIVRSSLCVIAYNTELVKKDDAPKSFADLLDPKWLNRLVKASPSYSGTIITSTYQLVRHLGWPYLEKLAKQKVMQVQSATDTPKKVILGERPVMVDGNEYNVFTSKETGKPIEPVYAAEGSPMIAMPSAIFAAAPHPNAARLFQSFLFTPEAQQLFVDIGGLRSVHALVKDKPGRVPLSSIKIMNTDPEGMIHQMDELKTRYSQYFGV